tara:strand:- start:246 stop:470 length:225 start_codon:yes stop_codon:yes gene_type:complete
MIFNKTLHSWAFLLESEYNPDNITLSHYEVNTVVISDSGVKYRNLEWLGEILPELAAWDVFQDAHESSEFLRRN